MQKTFDYYRSINQRLAASVDKDNLYNRYLQRVEAIVTKKASPDYSTTKQMSTLNKFHTLARQHGSAQNLMNISQNNRFLMKRIVEAKKIKFRKYKDGFVPSLHQKNVRQQAKIQDENTKMTSRVVNQKSCLNTFLRPSYQRKHSPQRINEKTFYESRVKERKLPKLIDFRF